MVAETAIEDSKNLTGALLVKDSGPWLLTLAEFLRDCSSDAAIFNGSRRPLTFQELAAQRTGGAWEQIAEHPHHAALFDCFLNLSGRWSSTYRWKLARILARMMLHNICSAPEWTAHGQDAIGLRYSLYFTDNRMFNRHLDNLRNSEAATRP